MKLYPALFAALFLAPLSEVDAAEVKLAAVFSDHMVLQREISVPIWGWTDAGAQVRVDFAGQSKSIQADATGQWMLRLEPLKVSAEPCGVFWVRKEIDLPEAAVGKDFRLSLVWLTGQYDTTYWNGVEVGRGGL